eukprot:719262-Lingulodinium_polyedra.AAC.1
MDVDLYLSLSASWIKQFHANGRSTSCSRYWAQSMFTPVSKIWRRLAGQPWGRATTPAGSSSCGCVSRS